MSRARRQVAALALACSVIAFPLGALASHQFADVPDSNPFHADIDALVDSGVTSGCGGGNYCPSANVTREQMAAFLNRLGALAPGKTPVVNATKLDGLDSSQFSRSDVAVTGHFRCGSGGWHPGSHDATWFRTSEYIYSTDGNGHFYCDALLPDGATIVAVRWRVRDSTATAAVDDVRLWMSTGVSTELIAALPEGTGAVANVPGDVVLEDLTITSPVVDNANHTYILECNLDGVDANLRCYDAVIEYTVSGAPVW